MRSLEESSLGEKCRNCCKCEFISFMNEHTCSGNSLSPAVIALMQARIISPVRSRTPVRGAGFSLLYPFIKLDYTGIIGRGGRNFIYLVTHLKTRKLFIRNLQTHFKNVSLIKSFQTRLVCTSKFSKFYSFLIIEGIIV